MAEHDLDCRNLQCPMPIVRVSQAVRGMSAGELLAVTASDSAFRADIHAWAQMTGHTIVSFEEDGVQRAVIRVR